MPDDAATPPEKDADSEPDSNGADTKGPDALAEALERVAEAREYLTQLAAAEFDLVKLKLRRVAVRAVVGIAALVLLLALLAAAASLLLTGVAQLVGSLLHGPAWLGNVVTGLGFLILVAVAIAIGLWAWQASSFEATRERFAARKRRQEGKFGRTADDHPASDQQ